MFSPMRLETLPRPKSQLKVNKLIKKPAKLTMSMAMAGPGHRGRPSDRIFFIYDHSIVQREEDDPNDAIVYFYPHAVNIDTKCLLCGQLMGMVNLMKTIGGSLPRLYRLKKLKIATKHEVNFTLALASKQRTPSEAVIGKLNHLYAVFAFYHGSLHQVQQECGNDREVFLKKMDAIWDCYLPFIRRYGNTVPAMFEPIPRVRLPKTANLLFLRCSHILQWLKSQKQLLGGCILYKNSVLCSQLTPDLTSRLLLIRPNQSHLPSNMVPVDYSLPFGVRVMSVYLTKAEYRWFHKQNKDLSQNRSSKTENPIKERTSYESNRAKDHESPCTVNPQSAPRQIPKVAAIPSLAEVLTELKSSSQSSDCIEAKEHVERTHNTAAEKDVRTSEERSRQSNADSDASNENSAVGCGVNRHNACKLAAVNGCDVLQDCDEEKSKNTSREKVVGNGDITREEDISHEQDTAMQMKQQHEIPNGLELLIESLPILPNWEENGRTSDVVKKNPMCESKDGIYEEDSSKHNTDCITSDSQQTQQEKSSSCTDNNKLVNNFDHSINSNHGDDCCYGDGNHHGDDGACSDDKTLHDGINNSLEKVQLKLPSVVANGEIHVDATNQGEDNDHDRTALLEDLSDCLKNFSPYSSKDSTNQETCASDISETVQNVEIPQKEDPLNIIENRTVQNISNDLEDDKEAQKPHSLQCNSKQEQCSILEDNSNIANNLLEIGSSGETGLLADTVVGGSPLAVASGDNKKNHQEDHGSKKTVESEEIGSSGDTGLHTDTVVGGSPLAVASGDNKKNHQEDHGSMKTVESEEIGSGGNTGLFADTVVGGSPLTDARDDNQKNRQKDHDFESGEFSSGDDCAQDQTGDHKMGAASTPVDNTKVKGMINVSLYVQAHSDMVLVYLAENSFVRDKAALFHLWRSVLTELGELEPTLKQCANRDTVPEDSIYNFIQYDNFDKSLHSTMDNPVTPVQSEFCRAADMLHHTFTKDDNVTDVVVRNHRSAVYAHHNASQQTFVQNRRSAPACTGIPARDDAAFFLDSSAQKLLYREHGINIV